MTRTGLGIELPAEVRRERDAWVASCPQLQVASQGSTAEEAMTMLREALALFIEGCCEQGIMDRVLKESGLEVPRRAGDPAL
ncbi:MAG: type II toxin-antitoxin system HicB family antitoxin [Holophagales bacterium]|nr:type II toxin-antitoxin system HicB family antitoxin [Holophagales bacterium]MYD22949.1 type II toxin-antitoxin system HicB family antitoxin [Holophagales bacterium]MYI32410.1 type II toxin-antitoxin system HicB family antitoxin [Holophagales bacterium]